MKELRPRGVGNDEIAPVKNYLQGGFLFFGLDFFRLNYQAIKAQRLYIIKYS